MLKLIMLGKLCSPLLLLLTITAAEGQDWNCQSVACEGHKAGYSWGMNHDVTESDCDAAGANTNSPSFTEGCKSAVRDKAWTKSVQTITPLVQSYFLGEQFAKSNRALPMDCEEVYDTLQKSLGESSAAVTIVFRNGCLDQAKKQAKRIIKENEKRARKAEKEAAKQVQVPK
jgi:hypothetical protein